MAGTEPVGQGTGNYRERELLAEAVDADAVQQQLESLDLGEVSCDGPDRVGLVKFRWERSRDAGEVADEVKRSCADMWKGWTPSVSPNHILSPSIDPVTAKSFVGMSDDVGGPSDLPEPTVHSLAHRSKDDVDGTGVVVGVADGGIVPHPFNEGSYLATAADFDDVAELDRTKLDPQDGHGTFVAGIILQQAPGAVVRMARVLDAKGETDIQTLANGIELLGRVGCDVINVSAGGHTRQGKAMMAFGAALRTVPPTTVVVAAAGNHGTAHAFAPRPIWPAAMPGVVAVAALAADNGQGVRLAKFSNYGPWVDVAAPGEDVLSTFLTFDDGERSFSGWATWSGTSFAAPRVAGAIAARMTEKGVKLRSALDAKNLVLSEADGRRWDAATLAGRGDPGPGRYLRLPPKIKVR